MKRKNYINYLSLFFLSLIVSAALIGACTPVRQPEKNVRLQAEDMAIMATMCTNVYDEYSAGIIADEELLFVYNPELIAFKKSNGIYLRDNDGELCLYLELSDLELHREYTLGYKIFGPDNKLYSAENYSFTPDILPWHAWNTQEITPEDRKELPDGSWTIKVTLNGSPIVNKVFVIHSSKDSSDLARKQFNRRIQAELVREIVTDKLHKNGALFFCNNDCYRGCYNISRSTCVDELNLLVASCIERATKAEQLDLSTETESPFGTLWALCMQVEHALMHPDLADNISECINNCPVEEDEAIRELLQN